MHGAERSLLPDAYCSQLQYAAVTVQPGEDRGGRKKSGELWVVGLYMSEG